MYGRESGHTWPHFQRHFQRQHMTCIQEILLSINFKSVETLAYLVRC